MDRDKKHAAQAELVHFGLTAKCCWDVACLRGLCLFVYATVASNPMCLVLHIIHLLSPYMVKKTRDTSRTSTDPLVKG